MKLTLDNSRRWFKIIAPCLVLVLGAAAASYYLESKPRIRARKGQTVARLVQTHTVQTESARPVITGNGQVRAIHEVNLRSRLKGEITRLPDQYIPGGQISRGEVLLQIDPRDHELAIQKARAGVAKAQATLEEEKGRHRVARLEYELSGNTLSDNEIALVLRKPQLAEAEASLKRAEAELTEAQIDYERTHIKAPFDGQIRARHVSIGSVIQENTNLFDLVATDAFWLEVSLPAQYLTWLTFPASGENTTVNECKGSRVHIRNTVSWPEDMYRQGCLVSLLPELDDKVRTATILVEIKDPLSLKPDNRDKPKILVNEFLQAEIRGHQIDHVVSLPRRLLQQGNRVWLMDGDNKLESREVSIAYHGRDDVLINGGLVAGEKLVTTSLPGAIEGIALRTDEREKKKQAIALNESGQPASEERL
ncbi:efflux RND transporter periplasmic adaptor subunit [Endozoicomonas elysicola]|uniref:RND efflux pump membrane fusion protein barrel-sandwich domain-containing protein n=1 Tax=Endozoicomonas elysicola TaxID=305900 RepID=A0A081K7H1_9GAMM|nr:efflux RND transporter periplasmic adaptor subunit [Endozoicomonas elysicola]KEI70097.1 hypothetical protein GV64_04455 [Endozoicomonas elysicola]